MYKDYSDIIGQCKDSIFVGLSLLDKYLSRKHKIFDTIRIFSEHFWSVVIQDLE